MELKITISKFKFKELEEVANLRQKTVQEIMIELIDAEIIRVNQIDKYWNEHLFDH